MHAETVDAPSAPAAPKPKTRFRLPAFRNEDFLVLNCFMGLAVFARPANGDVVGWVYFGLLGISALALNAAKRMRDRERKAYEERLAEEFASAEAAIATVAARIPKYGIRFESAAAMLQSVRVLAHAGLGFNKDGVAADALLTLRMLEEAARSEEGLK